MVTPYCDTASSPHIDQFIRCTFTLLSNQMSNSSNQHTFSEAQSVKTGVDKTLQSKVYQRVELTAL